ncbi:MAG TPA: LysR family transcriptional regulator [Ferrovibrio sp.]|uniref:LysR family transcriptional regulator n=1 Tax=Ferrovibrio sp. TaxID=1917215 RepID=UPI002ED53C8F
MNLAALDLNLLVALDALLTDAHVGRAAMRVGLSQPAMSHTLRRLREVIGDPLLVRTGARMELTPRAQQLRAPLRQALDQVRGLFVADGFDPASATRRFALMMPDLLLNLIVMPLVERVAAAAPGVALDVLPWRGPAIMTPELARNIDLVIACTPDAFDGFHRQRLYSDSDVLAVRKGHPQAAKLKRLPGFMKARHIAVVDRGQREDMIDAWLREQHGLARPIALTVPSYLQALHMAAASDLVAFVPRRLVEAQAPALRLAALTPPLDPGIDEQFMFWPVRAQMDPGSIWLRKQVAEIGRRLDRMSAKSGNGRRAAA